MAGQRSISQAQVYDKELLKAQVRYAIFRQVNVEHLFQNHLSIIKIYFVCAINKSLKSC